MTERLRCIGTASVVVLHKLSTDDLGGYGQVAPAESMQGNDAVLVARELADQGWEVECTLINPTEEDKRQVEDLGLTVTGTSPVPGAATRSTGLEYRSGRRHWLLSRTPLLDSPVRLGDARPTYADVYDEIEDFVLQLLSAHATVCTDLYLNLSQSRQFEKAEKAAALEPLMVQASWPTGETTGSSEVKKLAAELRLRAHSQFAVVTAGSLGSAISGPDGERFHAPEQVLSSSLGAGARFSAGIIQCLRLEPRDGAELLAAGSRHVVERGGA